MNSVYRGRIAPSPTGYLHLGHASTFWTAYQRCLQRNGTLIYRDEDIDTARCKQEFSKAALEDLSRLGITWNEGPFLQSQRLDHYRRILSELATQGAIYPCPHSRKTINEHPASIQSPEGETLFPKALRPSTVEQTSTPDLSLNWRYRIPDETPISFNDLNCGHQTFTPDKHIGDFLVWRKEGMPAYELAVVVDDHLMQITEVVRGQDLLLSTARQLLLYKTLHWAAPDFYHCPLIKDEQGKRLAKRSDSLALRTLFEQGNTAEEILQRFEA